MPLSPAPKTVMAPIEFAHLGEGEVAYVRELMSEDVQGLFPNAPEIQPGIRLWALINANGAPIMIADSREVAFASALEHELTTLSLH
ncbi:DUF1150 domain-containing protein [Prosthecomicrobium sp. N25]|uniref:BQ00720 family protein n=1 Tax=Prosthecomicrobium sp. N25 TaxID=3129254 RepID=UPI003076DCA8